MGFCEVCGLEYPSHQPHESMEDCIEKLKARIDESEVKYDQLLEQHKTLQKAYHELHGGKLDV